MSLTLPKIAASAIIINPTTQPLRMTTKTAKSTGIIEL
jgi:hypothetical protein